MKNGLGAVNSQGVNELAVNEPKLQSAGIGFECEAIFNASCTIVKHTGVFFFCESEFNASCSVIPAHIPGPHGGFGRGFSISVPEPFPLHRTWELRASFRTDSKFSARARVLSPVVHSAQAIFHVRGRLVIAPILLRNLDVRFFTDSELDARPEPPEEEEMLLMGVLVHSGES